MNSSVGFEWRLDKTPIQVFSLFKLVDGDMAHVSSLLGARRKQESLKSEN